MSNKWRKIEWEIAKENGKSGILEFNLSVFWQAAASVMKPCIAWRRTETWIRQKTRRVTREKTLYCIRRGCHNFKSEASEPLLHRFEFRFYDDCSRAIFCDVDLLTYMKLSYEFQTLKRTFVLTLIIERNIYVSTNVQFFLEISLKGSLIFNLIFDKAYTLKMRIYQKYLT